ncbi:MAG: type I secretion system permease/ATPase [Nitrosomonadales bacterium]|nr:type I secretion system permease/ATPase [Nitrosomonadales bacterium]
MGLAPHYRKVVFFGLFTNLMVLAPSWYMLEVYGRVIFSRNLETLVMLTMMVVFVYLIMECLEWVRRKMMFQATQQLDEALNQKIFNTAFQAKLKAFDFPVSQVFSDYRALKESLYSQALAGLIDLPFLLIFIVAIYFIHPMLCYLTLIGLVVQTGIAVLNQYRVQPQMKEANQFAIAAQSYFSSITQKSEVVKSMGMLDNLQARWLDKQQGFLLHQARASETAGKTAAFSKLLQVMQTSLVLGLGCYLVINNSLEHGAAMMIIASILATRVLSPFTQLITQWRALSNALEAYARLKDLLDSFPDKEKSMPLPPPTGDISVENLSFSVTDQEKVKEPILRNIHFKLNPGEVLLIAGPSASGKTTLSKMLVGLLAPSNGKVRFSGVDAYQWSKEELGQHIGYMPQNVELLDGSIAENITRFGNPDEQKLSAAIDLLNLHSLIVELPEGIHTQIGSNGEFLSGGRRQLIGLARAIYGNPAILVLDEPNANLDEAGEQALQHMVKTLKSQGTTFVIVSHLQGIKSVADYLLVMMKGQMLRYGKPDEVMASFQYQKPAGDVRVSA